MDEPALPFDSVEVDDGKGPRRVSVAQLHDIPLTVRVQLLLEGKLRVLRGKERVDAKLALRALAESARRRRPGS